MIGVCVTALFLREGRGRCLKRLADTDPQALTQAMDFSARVTILPELAASIYIFSVIDRITNREGQINSILVGARTEKDSYSLLNDAEILTLLNNISELEKHPLSTQHKNLDSQEIEKVKQFIQSKIKTLDLPFLYPELTEHSVFLNMTTVHK